MPSGPLTKKSHILFLHDAGVSEHTRTHTWHSSSRSKTNAAYKIKLKSLLMCFNSGTFVRPVTHLPKAQEWAQTHKSADVKRNYFTTVWHFCHLHTISQSNFLQLTCCTGDKHVDLEQLVNSKMRMMCLVNADVELGGGRRHKLSSKDILPSLKL